MACGGNAGAEKARTLILTGGPADRKQPANDYIHGALHEALHGMLFNGINNGFIPDIVSARHANHPVYQSPSGPAADTGCNAHIDLQGDRGLTCCLFAIFVSSRCHNASTFEMEELAIGRA